MTTLRPTQAFSAPARLAAVALTLACVAAPARAGLTIQVLDATASPGGTGSFDIVLTDGGGTFQVGGFTADVSVAAASGVTFTAADTLTDPATHPYIFGTYQSSPFPFATDPANPGAAATFPNLEFVAGDASMAAPGFVTLNPGDILGLVHVTFSVAANAPLGGGAPVSLVAGGNTSLSDVNGDPVAFSTLDGTITFTSVPEPSSLALCGLGSLGLAIYAGRRRSFARSS
jgi:hypothetical protein